MGVNGVLFYVDWQSSFGPIMASINVPRAARCAFERLGSPRHHLQAGPGLPAQDRPAVRGEPNCAPGSAARPPIFDRKRGRSLRRRDGSHGRGDRGPSENGPDQADRLGGAEWW